MPAHSCNCSVEMLAVSISQEVASAADASRRPQLYIPVAYPCAIRPSMRTTTDMATTSTAETQTWNSLGALSYTAAYLHTPAYHQ